MPIDIYDEELEDIEVELPPDLLEDIDDFAVTKGYQSPSDVVRAALE
jgi:Arc/MetJ-type ribon-helix-helix transcriptional regulator